MPCNPGSCSEPHDARTRLRSAARSFSDRPWRRLLQAAVPVVGLVVIASAVISSSSSAPEPVGMGMEIEPLTPDLATALGLPRDQRGVYVSDAVGVALASGIKEGDVIVSVNGQPTLDLTSYRAATAQSPTTLAARVDFIRGGVIQALVIDPTLAPAAPSASTPVALPGPAGPCVVAPCGPGYGLGPGPQPMGFAGPSGAWQVAPGPAAWPAAQPVLPLPTAPPPCYGPGCPLR